MKVTKFVLFKNFRADFENTGSVELLSESIRIQMRSQIVLFLPSFANNGHTPAGS